MTTIGSVLLFNLSPAFCSVPFLPIPKLYFPPCAHFVLLGWLQITALVPIRFSGTGCSEIAHSSLAVSRRATFIHQPVKHSTSNNFVPHLPDLTKAATVEGSY